MIEIARVVAVVLCAAALIFGIESFMDLHVDHALSGSEVFLHLEGAAAAIPLRAFLIGEFVNLYDRIN